MKQNIDSLINSAFAGLQTTDVQNVELVNEILDKYNLRWSVSKQELQLQNGTPTGYFAVVRDDNSKIMMACKDSYKPYQNSELAELLIKLSGKTGYDIHNGGYFEQGKKVYIQLDSQNTLQGIGKNNDVVKGYITGINSHDGTTTLRFGSTNITISCRNTFNAAYRSMENRIRHTRSMQDKIDQYLFQIEGAIEVESTIFSQYKRFADIPMDKKDLIKVVDKVTGVDINTPTEEAKEKYGTYKINRANDLMSSIANEIEQKGASLWGLFSGVTHYTQYKMPLSKDANARTGSKLIGMASNIDNQIYDLLSV